jgi:hypothetical protein
MKRWLLFAMLLLAKNALAQDQTETREMIGHVGGRGALLVLHATQRTDGGWQMAGEYLLLPTLVRRYLEGERGPELGVATLKEGTSAILFGRAPTGELRGTLRGGVFKGTRFGPGGQERERFEFSEEFRPMEAYSAAVRCEAGDERYASSLHYAVEAGRLKAFEWTSKLAASGHTCAVGNLAQQPLTGGLKFASGNCSVTLREVGEHVKVGAEGCAQLCGSAAYLEPLLVDRRGHCRLMRPDAK